MCIRDRCRDVREQIHRLEAKIQEHNDEYKREVWHKEKLETICTRLRNQLEDRDRELGINVERLKQIVAEEESVKSSLKENEKKLKDIQIAEEKERKNRDDMLSRVNSVKRDIEVLSNHIQRQGAEIKGIQDNKEKLQKRNEELEQDHANFHEKWKLLDRDFDAAERHIHKQNNVYRNLKLTHAILVAQKMNVEQGQRLELEAEERVHDLPIRRHQFNQLGYLEIMPSNRKATITSYVLARYSVVR
eukprot:TRINITY_DN9008_c0_g1_i10.p1 TRINITY_DN9008_c0_g1~~TRINITY_DN9008_c0_g1_i10.p1  ORF type:complete len:270 (+),score=57.48 TRINITY_DN9008_c0_g1_i10:73-810(+)